MFNGFAIPMTPTNLALLFLLVCATFPIMATYLFGCFRLFFGTLYPAYASYKAVKTKNVKEYVKWMMYWIVFAFFTCAETFTDVFLGFWFPFYYEIKIMLVLWLLSPATRGSSILYRKFVHPQLAKREKEIDEYLNRAKDQGYQAVVHLGSKGFTYASQVLVQTALKGGNKIVTQLQRSYSLSDLDPQDPLLQGRGLNRALPYAEKPSDQVDTPIEEIATDFPEEQHGGDVSMGDDSESDASPRKRVSSSPSPPMQLSRVRRRAPVPPSQERQNVQLDGKTLAASKCCQFCSSTPIGEGDGEGKPTGSITSRIEPIDDVLVFYRVGEETPKTTETEV